MGFSPLYRFLRCKQSFLLWVSFPVYIIILTYKENYVKDKQYYFYKIVVFRRGGVSPPAKLHRIPPRDPKDRCLSRCTFRLRPAVVILERSEESRGGKNRMKTSSTAKAVPLPLSLMLGRSNITVFFANDSSTVFREIHLGKPLCNLFDHIRGKALGTQVLANAAQAPSLAQTLLSP